MIKKVAAIRYAKAYFAHCQKTNNLMEIVNESEKIIEIISNNSNLYNTLKNKTCAQPKEKKYFVKNMR